jgi:hypothetical protein
MLCVNPQHSKTKNERKRKKKSERKKAKEKRNMYYRRKSNIQKENVKQWIILLEYPFSVTSLSPKTNQ